MSPSIMLRAAAKATVTTHVLVSSMFLLHGTFAGTLPPDKDEGWVLDKNAKLFAWLPQLDLMVVECYAGHGVEARHLPPSQTSSGAAADSGMNDAHSSSLVKLARTATFEDAAVICRGPQEIAEAFRALRVAKPEFLSHPHRISVERGGANHADGALAGGGGVSLAQQCIVTYYLHQRYTGFLTVRSLLQVTVETGAAGGTNKGRSKDVSGGASTVRVVKIEERWNGVKPLDDAPFRLFRRVNGVLSWWLTSLLVY